VAADDLSRAYRTLDDFTLSDVESVRIVLNGASVIDWHRLNFRDRDDLYEFLRVQEFDVARPADLDRLAGIKNEAVDYLRRTFDYPIPRSVEAAAPVDVFMLASSKGHKQVCACIILKVMHIIHHLQGRELLYVLPMSDAELFHLVEEKVYRVVGGMLASGLPIVEFLGGRKNRDSLYTKLLSKSETIAAQIYDKLRFRIVTRSKEDLLPVLNLLTRRLFPWNYTIPGESTNTLVDFPRACAQRDNLRAMLPTAQGGNIDDRASANVDNQFSARSYEAIHFVVDMPVRVPRDVIRKLPPHAVRLGAVIFMLTEFQIVDQESDSQNELGEASHARYKERQRMAVMDRLRLGFRQPNRKASVEAAALASAAAAASAAAKISRPPKKSH